MYHDLTFLSLRFTGFAGDPPPRRPPTAACPMDSRRRANVATSSQKASRRTRKPAAVRKVQSFLIWVLLPAPSIPEKPTTLRYRCLDISVDRDAIVSAAFIPACD